MFLLARHSQGNFRGTLASASRQFCMCRQTLVNARSRLSVNSICSAAGSICPAKHNQRPTSAGRGAFCRPKCPFDHWLYSSIMEPSAGPSMRKAGDHNLGTDEACPSNKDTSIARAPPPSRPYSCHPRPHSPMCRYSSACLGGLI